MLGKQISELRKQKKLSQEDLAEAMQVSRQAISKWENGLSNPDTENLIRLAEILEVDVNVLINSQLAGAGLEPECETRELPQNQRKTVRLLSVLLIAAICTACVFAGLWLAEIRADQYSGQRIYQNVSFVDGSNLMEAKQIYLTEVEQEELAAFIKGFHFTKIEDDDDQDILYGGRIYYVSFSKEDTQYNYVFTANGFSVNVTLCDGQVVHHEFEVDYAMFYYLDALTR